MKSIRDQLLLGLLAGALVSTLLAGGATYLKVRNEANELFNGELKQIATYFPTQLAQGHPLPGIENPEDDIVVQAWDANGRLVYSTQPRQPFPRFPITGFGTVRFARDSWRVYGEEQHGQSGRFVQVAQAESARQELAAKIALRSLVSFLFLIPVLAGLIAIVVRRSLAPLHKVAHAVGQRSPAVLQPLETDAMPPEIVPILEALNGLLQRLDLAMTAQRAFIADAAHELRSPLAALKLQLQLAERAADRTQQTAAFAKLHDRLDRATHLVQQLLTLARQESIPSVRDMQLVDLHRVAQQVVGDKSALAENKHIDLGLEILAPVPNIDGDPDSLGIMLGNLVDNAIRYTPPGGRVDVRIVAHGVHVLLQVIDTGPGITPEEQARVFDRFYRGDESNASGSGLGLAIVKSIADQHHAHISMNRNEHPSGLMVSVAFMSTSHAKDAAGSTPARAAEPLNGVGE